MVLEPLVSPFEGPRVPPLTYKVTEIISEILNEKIFVSPQIETTAEKENAMPQDGSGNVQTESPSGFVNPLGEPLITSTYDMSSEKPCSEIEDLWVGKGNDSEEFAYILAGTDEKLQEKYGEPIYDHIIYPSVITHLEREGKPKWGFLLVEKLPRWRKIVRGVVGFITLVGTTALLTPVVGTVPALLIGAAAAIGVRKLLTLGRSVEFSAETAELKLTNGYVPKRDYDIFQRLVREAANCTQSGVEVAVGAH
jgi:hypothetical protein